VLRSPGHVDFTIEVERSARVLDGSVIIVDAVSGVQAQTQTVWRQVQKQHIPSIAFVNKMDRDGASFTRTVESLRKKLGANPVPIQMPIGSEDKFLGVVDLISMRKFTWEGVSKTSIAPTVQVLQKNDALYDEAVQRREALLEAVAEVDEVFMERYLELSDAPEVDGVPATLALIKAGELLDALRRSCLRNTLVPILCGASLRGKGVEPLLDSVLAFLPNPLDNRPFSAVDKKTSTTKELTAASKDFCALAFKVTYDAARGPLVFARVFSGTLTAKHTLYNASQEKKERINQLLAVSADDLATLPQCGPGEVCCLVGLKHTSTGDTLVIDGSPLRSYVLEGLNVPPPVFALAVEPEKTSLQDELEKALKIMCLEDPSLKMEVSAESGQTLIRGIGELHLEIVIDRLKRQFGLEVTTGQAYVAYREGLQAQEKFKRKFTYDRTVGPRRLFATVEFSVHPTGTVDAPAVTLDEAVQEALSVEEYASLHDGLHAALSRGPRGYPVVGVNITARTVTRDADTTPGAVRACASLFISDLLRNEDERVLLEPMMYVEVELPEKFVGGVLSDLTVQRRAHIRDIIANVDAKHIIQAQVPLATMLGYATSLRSMTQGEGSFSAEYDTHLPVDPSVAKL
jgi:elongation factor G